MFSNIVPGCFRLAPASLLQVAGEAQGRFDVSGLRQYPESRKPGLD
jgi:hypothetical protein